MSNHDSSLGPIIRLHEALAEASLPLLHMRRSLISLLRMRRSLLFPLRMRRSPFPYWACADELTSWPIMTVAIVPSSDSTRHSSKTPCHYCACAEASFPYCACTGASFSHCACAKASFPYWACADELTSWPIITVALVPSSDSTRHSQKPPCHYCTCAEASFPYCVWAGASFSRCACAEAAFPTGHAQMSLPHGQS
jgi:hypothetical protein